MIYLYHTAIIFAFLLNKICTGLGTRFVTFAEAEQRRSGEYGEH